MNGVDGNEGRDPDREGPGAEPKGGPRLRRFRAVASAVLPTILVLLVLEGGSRVAASPAHDWSSYYLFYGFQDLAGRVGISPWWVYEGGQYKFPSNYTLRHAAGQGDETATTNSLGFRGPEFDPDKPDGTVRVIALGGSSTFGFHNSDDGTYPRLLENLFRADTATAEVEVVNAGFPYYNTGSIRTLLREELLAYDPDILTLYSAYNDTSWPREVGAGLRAVTWIQQHSMTYHLLSETVLTDRRIYKVVNTRRRWSGAETDLSALLRHAERVAAPYRTNLKAIGELAEAAGADLVLVRQPMTAHYREPGAGMSYGAEYRAVLRKAASGATLTPFERRLIIHRRLIAELDAFARRRGHPVVDAVALVDERRDRLASWVHLTEEANLRLAEALKRRLEPLVRRRRGRRVSGIVPETTTTSGDARARSVPPQGR